MKNHTDKPFMLELASFLCRSLLAGDSGLARQTGIPNRLQAGSYTSDNCGRLSSIGLAVYDNKGAA
jgi:hypothetical protein